MPGESKPDYHCPLTPRRLDLLVPCGWESESEAEPEPVADWKTPPHDIIEAFLTEPTSASAAQPAPPLRFAAPITTDSEIEKARKSAVPKTTQRDTLWCIGLWKEWTEERNKRTEEQVPSDICALSPQLLQHWMSRFVLEVRKRDGTEYPPDTLFHIVCGIMRFIRGNGKPQLDFLKEKEYAEFRSTLDAEMKRLKQAGTGSRKRQAEPLTQEEEELLWEKGVLGDHSPQALLNSVFFLNGVCFALRSGDEHRRLCFKDSQIRIVEKSGERDHLVYTKDSSKNNQGGLRNRKLQTKRVIHHANTKNPARCPVRLLRLYNSLCPKDCPDTALYLQPLKNPKPQCWYSVKPVGHNTLDSMVRSMCNTAGIVGYKTNHSLRVTTATRLFQAGIDEQLIMERTGHRSLDGVWSYKRTSDEQRQALSDIVNLEVPVPEPKRRKVVAASACSQNNQQVGAAPAQISLQNCSNITFNFNYGSV